MIRAADKTVLKSTAFLTNSLHPPVFGPPASFAEFIVNWPASFSSVARMLNDAAMPPPRNEKEAMLERAEESSLSNSDALHYGSTQDDKIDMTRMGKKQELMRNFRFVSSIALTSCVMGTWEILLTVNTPALIAGGLPGLFWSMVWGAVGQLFIVLSLAEMSSMAPTV